MGPGGSLEAAYALKASVPAGSYHFIIDSIIIRAVDVQYDWIWRRGATDTTLATWMVHWEPLMNASFDAQAYEIDMPCPAIDFQPGDQLVFRYTGSNTTSMQAYIPNGDGELSKGRIPNITLPQ